MGRASGYISGYFAIWSQMSSPSATTTISSLNDPGSLPAVETGPVRNKQWGRGSQRMAESKRTSAQTPHVSLSPHREVSPVLFSQPDQRPSASASNLVLFGGSDEELIDDSMSLAASDAEELSGQLADPALLPSSAPSAAKVGIRAVAIEYFSNRVFYRKLHRLIE